MNKYNLDQIINHVLKKQHLKEDSKLNDVISIINDIGGLHVSNPTTPYLSLFARMYNFKMEDLNKEIEKRTVARIRCIRKTLFFLTKYLIPIAFAATSKHVMALSEKYLKSRGISDKSFTTTSDEILKILKYKELTTADIKKELKTNSDISTIINLLCDQGVLIRSKPVKSWKDRRNYYMLFEDYFPDLNLSKIPEKEAITLLLAKYLDAYSPCTEKDLVWWSGLTKTKVKAGLNQLQKSIIMIKIDSFDDDYFFLKDEESIIKKDGDMELTVNLIPELDPYIMGYKLRNRFLKDKNINYVFDRSGNAASTILINGKIKGIWDFYNKPAPIMKLHLFEKLNEAIMNKINEEGTKMGNFLSNKKIRLKLCDKMLPLTKRTAGSFLTPLKNC